MFNPQRYYWPTKLIFRLHIIIGSYLTDLTFMEDGNPDNTQYSGITMINFYKRELVYTTLREIKMFQQSVYMYVTHYAKEIY